MTVVVAWLSGSTAILCWDSAITRAGREPKNQQSSFGELQVLDGRAVEEGAIKLCDIAGLPALVTGDVGTAGAFAKELIALLDKHDLRTALARLDPVFRGCKEAFSLIFAHPLEGRIVLTRYASTSGLMEMNEPDPNTCWIDGSLPEHLKSLIRTGAYAVEGMPLEPPRKLLALLALMQAMGVAYYLPEHGVGGAFCGATFDGTITWQEPIIYLLSNTPTLEAAMSEAGTDGVSTTDPFQMIRCQVSDWVGLVGSSITRRFVVLHSPSERRTEEELRAFVQTFPDPFKWLVPSSAYAFIDTSKQRVVVALTRTDPPSPLVQIRSNPDVVAPDGLIFHRLREPLDPRFWDFVVFVDKPTGTQVAAHIGRIDLEHAIDDSSLLPSLKPPGS